MHPSGARRSLPSKFAIILSYYPCRHIALLAYCLSQLHVQVTMDDQGVAPDNKALLQQEQKSSTMAPMNFEATLHKDLIPWLAKHERFQPHIPLFFLNHHQVYQIHKQKERENY